MIHGVNYASAGAGIIFSSGSDLVSILMFFQVVTNMIYVHKVLYTLLADVYLR